MGWKFTQTVGWGARSAVGGDTVDAGGHAGAGGAGEEAGEVVECPDDRFAACPIRAAASTFGPIDPPGSVKRARRDR